MQYRIVQDYYGEHEVVLGTASSDDEAQPPGDQLIFLRFRAIPVRWDISVRLEPVPAKEPE